MKTLRLALFSDLTQRKIMLSTTLRECAAAIERASSDADVNELVSMAREALSSDTPDLKLISEQLERTSERLSSSILKRPSRRPPGQ